MLQFSGLKSECKALSLILSLVSSSAKISAGAYGGPPKFRNLKKTFENTPLSGQKSHRAEGEKINRERERERKTPLIVYT